MKKNFYNDEVNNDEMITDAILGEDNAEDEIEECPQEDIDEVELDEAEVAAIIEDFKANGNTLKNQIQMQKLYNKYDKLFYSVAHRVYHSYCAEHIEELVQSGQIGLFEAMKNYDPSKGIKFVSWAYPFIINGMRDYIALEVYHTTPYFYKHIKVAKKAIKEMKDSGHSCTDADVVIYLKMKGYSEKTISQIVEYLTFSKSVMSYDGGPVNTHDANPSNNQDYMSSLDSAVATTKEEFKDPASIYESNAGSNYIMNIAKEILTQDELNAFLMFSEEYEYTEIATYMDIKPAKASSLVESAREKMKVAVSAYVNNNNIDTPATMSLFRDKEYNAIDDVDFSDFAEEMSC